MKTNLVKVTHTKFKTSDTDSKYQKYKQNRDYAYTQHQAEHSSW